MTPVALTISLVCAGTAALCAALVLERRSRLAMASRIGAVAVSIAGGSRPEHERKSRTDRFDTRMRSFFGAGLRPKWGMRASGRKLLLTGAGAGTGVLMVAKGILGLPLFFTFTLAGLALFLAPRSLLKRQQQTTERQFVDRFPDAVDMIARMIRVGLPVTAAIHSVAAETPVPVSTVFERIAGQTRIGIPIGDALDTISREIGLPDLRFFAVAVILQSSTGGNLVFTLEVLTEIIRKRRAVHMKAKAVTSEVRFSAYVLGALPFLTIGALLLIQPDYLTPMFNDTRGQYILGGAAGGLILSIVSMQRMMKSVTGI